MNLVNPLKATELYTVKKMNFMVCKSFLDKTHYKYILNCSYNSSWSKRNLKISKNRGSEEFITDFKGAQHTSYGEKK